MVSTLPLIPGLTIRSEVSGEINCLTHFAQIEKHMHHKYQSNIVDVDLMLNIVIICTILTP